MLQVAPPRTEDLDLKILVKGLYTVFPSDVFVPLFAGFIAKSKKASGVSIAIWVDSVNNLITGVSVWEKPTISPFGSFTDAKFPDEGSRFKSPPVTSEKIFISIIWAITNFAHASLARSPLKPPLKASTDSATTPLNNLGEKNANAFSIDLCVCPIPIAAVSIEPVDALIKWCSSSSSSAFLINGSYAS